ncbi:hypothetical protein E4T56_gene20933, partial [Termitomyces sp. T112]
QQAQFGLGQQLQEIGHGLVQPDLDHAPGHGANILDNRQILPQSAALLRRNRAAQGQFCRLAAQPRAIFPRAVAQAEDIAAPLISHDPAFGQTRHDLAFVIEADQTLGRRGAQKGIERGRAIALLAHHHHAQRLLLGGTMACPGQQGGQQKGDAGNARHAPFQGFRMRVSDLAQLGRIDRLLHRCQRAHRHKAAVVLGRCLRRAHAAGVDFLVEGNAEAIVLHPGDSAAHPADIAQFHLQRHAADHAHVAFGHQTAAGKIADFDPAHRIAPIQTQTGQHEQAVAIDLALLVTGHLWQIPAAGAPVAATGALRSAQTGFAPIRPMTAISTAAG